MNTNTNEEHGAQQAYSTPAIQDLGSLRTQTLANANTQVDPNDANSVN